MNRLRLALLIIAALPLAGCGNKGPLTLAPRTEGAPPAQAAPAEPTSVAVPAEASTVVLPPAASTATAPPDPTQPIEDDGTPGTPR